MSKTLCGGSDVAATWDLSDFPHKRFPSFERAGECMVWHAEMQSSLIFKAYVLTCIVSPCTVGVGENRVRPSRSGCCSDHEHSVALTIVIMSDGGLSLLSGVWESKSGDGWGLLCRR